MATRVTVGRQSLYHYYCTANPFTRFLWPFFKVIVQLYPFIVHTLCGHHILICIIFLKYLFRQKQSTNESFYIDLQEKLVLPGFHDVHMHPMEVGSTTTVFSLDEFETNAENYISAIRNAANQNPNLPWIIGFGHSINTLFDAQRNPLSIIDDAVSDRPVIIMEQTSHSMWINSKGLELAGITAQTPNPKGGIIVKENGVLQGILVDNAGDVVFQQAIKALNDANGEYLGMTDYVLPELAKFGITSVSDARTYWKRGQHEVWIKLENEGNLFEKD